MKRAKDVNPDAYEAYLRGRYFWNKRTGDGLKKAVDYFNQAIEKDPTYAPYSELVTYSTAAGADWELQTQTNPIPPTAVRRCLNLPAKMKSMVHNSLRKHVCDIVVGVTAVVELGPESTLPLLSLRCSDSRATSRLTVPTPFTYSTPTLVCVNIDVNYYPAIV